MSFRATLQLHGKSATGIEVPAAVVEALGAGQKPKVRATLNGYTYRSSVAVRHGVYMLPVSAEHRSIAHVQAGEEVTVSLELDTEAREVAVPADLQAALSQAAEALHRFGAMSYSNQLRLVLSIEQAKTAETRQRRLEKVLSELHESPQ